MKQIRILVVEDERVVAMDIKNRLNRLGYAVAAEAVSGEAAIKKAGEASPDLVLMDIMLEGKTDGIEAAEEIRSRLNIPVIYLTAHTDTNTLERAKLTEPFGYIIKPFEERALHTAIEMALYKHRMEAKLRESRERYRHIVEHAPAGVCEIDLNDQRFVYVNDVMCKYTGYEKKAFLSMRLPDILGKGGKNPFMEKTVKTSAANKGSESSECKIRRKDGSEFWSILSISNMHENGKPITAIIVLSDITKEKQAEKERLEKEKLKGVLEMAGAVCHELNQPMQAISLCCELLIKTGSENDPDYTDIRDIFQEVKRMSEIIGKLTRITRYENIDYIEGIEIIDIDKASNDAMSSSTIESLRS